MSTLLDKTGPPDGMVADIFPTQGKPKASGYGSGRTPVVPAQPIGELGRQMMRRVGVLCLLILISASVAGCKSDGAAGPLDPAALAPDPKPAAPAGDKVGSGSVRIAVLLPAGGSTEQIRDIRDGITMAVEDLGSDVLTVEFKAQSSKPKEAAVSAIGEGVAALIGPIEKGPATEVATITGGTLTPIFLLAQDVPGHASTYSVPLMSGRSAAAGARAVAKDGGRNFVLITRDDGNAVAVEKAVDFAVADHGGRIAAQARFGPDQASIEKAIDTVFQVVTAPDAIVVAGASPDPAALVKAVRSRNPKVKIIGNSSWLSSAELGMEFDGVLIADIDRSEIEPVAQRFRARFGHDFGLTAAYAYDVIALSSGIARATGKEGFVQPIIEDQKGFRGSTGIFRFRDGGSERLLALYRVEKGKLRRIEAPPQAF